MTKQEILTLLENFTRIFPREAIEEVQSKKINITSELLESLDYVNQNVEELQEKHNDYFLHFYAMYLLAQSREKSAFSKLIAFLYQPEKHLDFILGDILTEDFPSILCSTFDGVNLKALTDIIEDRGLFKYARSAAVYAYSYLYEEGIIAEEEYISYFRSLIYNNLTSDDSHMPTFLVHCIIDTKLIQMIPDVRFLYDNGCIETSSCGHYDSFLDSILSSKDYVKRNRYIDDVIGAMDWWACFKNDHTDKGWNQSGKDFTKGLEKMILTEMEEDRKQNQVTVQKAKKVGRNDPCPCGSGKKYKKCCYIKNPQECITASPVIRLEDKYDLLKYYPKDSPMFKTLFDEEAIEIDIPVYMALHHRAIPMWVKRDYQQEELDKIYYLNEAMYLFGEKCRREQITSFAAYDEKFMVHYRSSQWMEELISLTEYNELPEIDSIRKKALDTMESFCPSNTSHPK